MPSFVMTELARCFDLEHVGRLYSFVDATVEFMQRAADAIRPGSLERVAPHGLAEFVVAARDLLERRGTTAGRRRRT